ncbi:MAG: UDP-2,3-diacylglucosamine diphosphatase [Pseudomonadota bacterium]
MSSKALHQYFPRTFVRHHSLIVLSDIHFGKKSCRADMLLEFLLHNTCDTLILNGDILDGWVMEKKKHRKLPEMQKRVLDLINARVAGGTKVVYIPGNHDERLRQLRLSGQTKWDILFADSYLYTDRQDRRFFIVHGDQFDPAFLREKATVLYHIGDTLYDAAIEMNAVASKMTYKLVKRHFSAAAYLKHQTKGIVNVIGDFTGAVMRSADKEKVDGVICGHIHHAEWSKYGPTIYGNSGDWVESCTALCEDMQGNWRVLDWFNERQDYGLKPSDAVSTEDVNASAAFRPVTEHQLRAAQRIWHPKDYKDIVKQRRKIKRHIHKHHNKTGAKHARKAEKHRATLATNRNHYKL